MELTGRLAAVAGFITPGVMVADIGTDHARLPIYLVKSGQSPGAIAADINRGPYEAACRAVSLGRLQDKIEVRQGDGMSVLQPGEAGVVVMAGMGGNTIRTIIEKTRRSLLAGIQRLVLQPMADAGDLRRWLAGNGWRMADEVLVEEDGRLYVIIAVEPGAGFDGDPLLLEIGPRLVERKDPLLPLLLDKQINEYRRILSALSGARNEDARNKAENIKAKLARAMEVLKNVN